MEHKKDQTLSASPWVEDLGSSSLTSSSCLSQKADGFVLPDAFDDRIDIQPNFYLGDDFAHLFSGLFPATNEGVHSPESSPSPLAIIGSTGPTDNGSRLAPNLPHRFRKVVALAPASPRSSACGVQQPPKASRYHKRREQNRAAQRAFRQRKEQHVKDLEDRVASLEKHREQTKAENVRLKEYLNKATAENNILRNLNVLTGRPICGQSASSSISSQCGSDIDEEQIGLRSPPASLGFDVRYMVDAKIRKRGSSMKGNQIWEFILGHRLYQDGLLDVGIVAKHVQKFLGMDTALGVTEPTLIECIEKSVKR